MSKSHPQVPLAPPHRGGKRRGGRPYESCARRAGLTRHSKKALSWKLPASPTRALPLPARPGPGPHPPGSHRGPPPSGLRDHGSPLPVPSPRNNNHPFTCISHGLKHTATWVSYAICEKGLLCRKGGTISGNFILILLAVRNISEKLKLFLSSSHPPRLNSWQLCCIVF